MISSFLRAARPKQWLKNILVFAAPGAAAVLDDPTELSRALLAFVAFCLAASGTYYWNDLFDIDADRAHPKKSKRPIAAGEIGIGAARVVGTALLFASIGVMALTERWQAVLVISTYIAVTLSYTIVLKHIAVVDLIAVASGFVLRAAGGATAAAVEMSSWFVLCTTFGSLFIVAGKRYAEIRELGDGARHTRSTMHEYSTDYLRVVLTIACGGAVVSYCVWAFERRDMSGSEWPFYELSIVPMLTALLRYALVLDSGDGAAPEDVFASDRVLQVLGLIWIVVFGMAVYTA